MVSFRITLEITNIYEPVVLFLEKAPESKSIFTEDSKKFQTNCYRIDAYANVVNWLDSTSALPLFPKPIKIKGQTDFPIEVRCMLKLYQRQ